MSLQLSILVLSHYLTLREQIRYRTLLNRTYVDDDTHLRWCPAPNCEYAIRCGVPARSLDVVVPTVECRCSNLFCFGCGEADHRPCCCPIVKRWLKKCADDSETANWISANTKECTNCHSTIEKNGGCNVSVLPIPLPQRALIFYSLLVIVAYDLQEVQKRLFPILLSLLSRLMNIYFTFRNSVGCAWDPGRNMERRGIIAPDTKRSLTRVVQPMPKVNQDRV